MATGLAAWSQTAASNNTADSSVNWQEGQAPSTVNDSARGMMAALAKWRDDNSGALTTGGTSTAFTVSSNQGFATLAALANQTLRFTMNATCGAAPTLSVDSLTAKALVFANGTAVAAGDLVSGTVHGVVYDNVNGVFVVNGGAAGAFPSGTLMLFQQTAAPIGWTKQTTHNDKALRVVSGTASSGGSTAFSTIMAARTIGLANLPAATLATTITDNGHSHTTFSSTSVTNTSANISVLSANPAVANSTQPAVTGITASTSLGGSGTAMDFAVQYVDLIICAKT